LARVRQTRGITKERRAAQAIAAQNKKRVREQYVQKLSRYTFGENFQVVPMFESALWRGQRFYVVIQWEDGTAASAYWDDLPGLGDLADWALQYEGLLQADTFEPYPPILGAPFQVIRIAVG
jgi:hypothetical protein